MTDQPPAPVAPAPVLAPAGRRLTFYFSASHKASYAPGRSLTYFKGQEYTECCDVGEQPAKRAGLVTLGTGTEADVTIVKPA